jgi:cell division protein FtsZ
MPNAKRASMREGPLAALFRKTAEDTGAPGGDAAPEQPTEAAAPSAPPASPAAEQPSATTQPAPTQPATTQPAPAEPAVTQPVTPAASAGQPPEIPPAPAAPAPAAPAAPEHRIPSPQERLRHAFSADIPENFMDRPRRPEPSQAAAPAAPAASASSPAPAPADEPDVYARSDRGAEAFGVPRPVGTPVLRVVGVGGAGVNAINRMVEAEIEGVEFLAINTDLQSLQQSAAHETLHIGDAITRGLGSGSNPDLGRQAAHEEHDRIKTLLRGSDMVFIAAGAGGGTGTGAAPVVAKIARDLGALTVGIITRPFQFEGSRRRDQAEAGITALADEVDTLIVVPNNRLLTVLDRNTSMVEAFRVADDVLRQGVQGISDLVTLPGLINLDFADVRTIMSDAGNALLGIGMGAGERRAIDAAEQAVASPLLETSMDGARSILLSITGGRDLSLWEVNEAAKAVAEAAHPDANIIFGAMVDEKLADQVWVTVVATGYGNGASRPRRVEEQREAAPRAVEARVSSSLREPRGEPRVSRARRAVSSPSELDVPEFIPRR